MTKIRQRVANSLASLQSKQRSLQKRIEHQLHKEGKLYDSNGDRVQLLYCKPCNLRYHENPDEPHDESEMHQKIHEFRSKKCIVCDIQFASPMLYEHHLASVNHLLGKKVDKDEDQRREDEEKEHDDDGDDDDDRDEANLDEYDTIDEAGREKSADGRYSDDEDEPKSIKEEEVKVKIEEEEEASPRKRAKMESDLHDLEGGDSLGKHYVRKVTLLYCDLCNKYVPKLESSSLNEQRQAHCESKEHAEKLAQKAAERQRKEMEALGDLMMVDKGGEQQQQQQQDHVVKDEEEVLDCEASEEDLNT